MDGLPTGLPPISSHHGNAEILNRESDLDVHNHFAARQPRLYNSTEAHGNSNVHQGDVLRGNTIHNHYYQVASNAYIVRHTDDRHPTPGHPAHGLHNAHASGNALQEEFEEQQLKEERRQQALRAQRYEVLFESLKFSRMSARLLNVEPAAFDTCRWILDHAIYGKWKDDSQLDTHHGFLWIKGKPGSGKSTIMKLLVDSSIKVRRHITVSYFFNGRAAGELEKSSLGLFRYLVSQLLKVLTPIKDNFIDTFEGKVFGDAVDEWTVTELKGFLLDVLCDSERPAINIFIDALDEGHDDDVRLLVTFLEGLTLRAIAAGNTKLRICLSSRHYPHISIRKGLPFMLDEEVEHAKDIRTFVSASLDSAAAPLLDEICRRAMGVFLWVVLVVPRLNAKVDQAVDIRAARDLLGKLPTDLDTLFVGILDRDAEDIGQCVKLLQWVSFAQIALSPDGLYAALAAESGDPCLGASYRSLLDDEDYLRKFFLHRSRGFLEVTRDERPAVQFIHETVRTFLLTSHGLPRIRPDLANNIEGLSHEMLKTWCLNFLTQYEHSFERMITHRSIERSAQQAQEHADEQFYAQNYFIVPKSHGMVLQPDDVREYAVTYMFRHLDAAESHGIPQQCCLQDLEQGQLLRTVCQCLLLFRFGRDYDPPAIEVYEPANLLILVKYLISGENDTDLFISALTAASVLRNADIARLIVEGSFKNNQRLAIAALQAYSSLSPATLAPLLLRPRGLAGSYAIEILVELGVDVNVIDHNTQGLGSALHAAVYWERRDIFEALISAGADVNKQGGLYGSVLQVAALQGDNATVYRLLNLNAAVNERSGSFGTAIQAAAYGCHLPVAETLLHAGADVNITGGTYGTALQAAAYRGDHGMVVALLEAGADINLQGGIYGTALQALVCSPEATLETLYLLLDHGVHIDTRGGLSDSALHAASVRATIEITSDEARPQDHDFQTCRAGSGRGCKVQIVVTLLCKMAKITEDDWREPGLIRAFHELFGFAIERQDASLTNTLLDAANDTDSDAIAIRALRGAAFIGDTRLASILLEHGAEAPCGEVVLHSCEYDRWTWDFFRDSRWRMASRFEWLTILDDCYCRGELNNASQFTDDLTFDP